MPYRSARASAPKLTADAGIVDDMVRQFADRHAFLRELVQNGIDAGATRIDVRLERTPEGAVRTSVEDDGAGMTRAIVEGPLLTLFQSSKETDSTKIGKYGIGFVSVFAIAPDRVDVRTRRKDEAWIVRLFGDHSFELATDAPRPGTGTEVTLLHTMTAEEFSVHAAQAKTALSRWCRHAHLPITFVARDGYDSGDAGPINEALSLPGVAAVTVTEGDERFVVATGDPSASATTTTSSAEAEATFGGFYGRGLTLMETTDAETGLQGIRFKIDSPRLSHTLSRDSVRRDDESRRVLGRVRELVDDALWTELLWRINEAAKEAATGGWESYASLIAAALAPPFAAKVASARVPLVDPIDGHSTMTLDALRRASSKRLKVVLVADTSSRLTRALAQGGRPVMRHVALAPMLRRVLGDGGLIGAERVFAFAAAIDERDEDPALVAELARVLRVAGCAVARVRLAAFEGVAHDSAFRVVKTAGDTALTAPETLTDRPWGGSATLFLNADHTTVRLARRSAKTSIPIAAHLLCRAILVADGPLDAKVVDRLLEAAGAPPGGTDG